MICFIVSLFVERLTSISLFSIMLLEYIFQAATLYIIREFFIVVVGVDMIEQVRDMNIDLGRDDNRWR